MRIRPLKLLLFCGLAASAQVSTNKVFVVNTNNVLPPNASNFFAANITLLTNALTNAGYGLGGGFSGTNIFQLRASNEVSAAAFSGGAFSGGTFSMPIVPSNQVSSSAAFVSPLIAGGLAEATGCATDGTNIYICYNDNTNGLGVYVETHTGMGTAPLGVVVASNYLYHTSATGYTVAGGMSYYQGLLYAVVGTNFSPSTGNAVIVFDTNCVLQGVHPLGQAPNFIQFFQPVSPTGAIACYFGTPYTGDAFPAGSRMPYFTIGSAATGTAWTTNGQYVPLSEVTEAEGFALDASGHAWIYGQSIPLTFEPPYNLMGTVFPSGFGAFQISEVNTNTGSVTVISYPRTTNALITTCGQITGNCFFWPTDSTKLNVVIQGAVPAGPYANPNTNFLIGFPVLPGADSGQMNSGGLVKAPFGAFGALTAEQGTISNVTILASPNLYVTNTFGAGGLVILSNSAAGLSASQASMKADTSGNLIFDTISGDTYIEKGGSAIMIFDPSGVNCLDLFQPFSGIANVPSIAGAANSTASLSNAITTNLVAQRSLRATNANIGSDGAVTPLIVRTAGAISGIAEFRNSGGGDVYDFATSGLTAFSGAWAVDNSGNETIAGAFTGNGAGLTNIPNASVGLPPFIQIPWAAAITIGMQSNIGGVYHITPSLGGSTVITFANATNSNAAITVMFRDALTNCNLTIQGDGSATNTQWQSLPFTVAVSNVFNVITPQVLEPNSLMIIGSQSPQ